MPETFCVWNICSSKVLSEIDYLISVGLFYYILILNACLQISSSEEEYFEKGAEGSIVLFSKRVPLKLIYTSLVYLFTNTTTTNTTLTKMNTGNEKSILLTFLCFGNLWPWALVDTTKFNRVHREFPNPKS